jgi:hypothetical protein
LGGSSSSVGKVVPLFDRVNRSDVNGSGEASPQRDGIDQNFNAEAAAQLAVPARADIATRADLAALSELAAQLGPSTRSDLPLRAPTAATRLTPRVGNLQPELRPSSPLPNKPNSGPDSLMGEEVLDDLEKWKNEVKRSAPAHENSVSQVKPAAQARSLISRFSKTNPHNLD